jgi:hypothetical protein
MVSENEVLRRIFGSKGMRVVGRLRKLHSEKLYNFCTSLYIVRRMKSMRIKSVDHVPVIREMTSVQAHNILVGKPLTKISLG